MGKKARDTVTLTLEPEDAFGESEPELILLRSAEFTR